jgi:hypothetical protein
MTTINSTSNFVAVTFITHEMEQAKRLFVKLSMLMVHPHQMKHEMAQANR